MFKTADSLNSFLSKYFDKPERMSALHQLHHELPDEVFWPVFGSVWMGSESLYRDETLVREMLTSQRLASDLRSTCMDEEDRRKLSSLPNMVRVWRGCWEGNQFGWSFTVDEKKARWFANRCPMDGRPLLVSGMVKKADIIAYFGGRSESEIVLPPEKLERRKTRRMAPKSPSDTDMLFHAVQAYGSTAIGGNQVGLMEALTLCNSMGEERYLRFCDERIALYAKYGFTKKAAEWEVKKNVMHDETMKKFMALSAR